MIVKCDKCQTRFKIPDEKVTEKGVKVRCTRCQHTFRVSRAPADGIPPVPPAAPPPPAVNPDPFASFGIGAPVEPDQATRPGFFPEGIAATRSTSSPGMSAVLGMHQDLPPEVFDSPTRIAPVPAEVRNRMPQAAPAPLPPPVAPPPGLDAGFDPSDPFASIDPRPSSDFAPTSPAVATVPPPEAFAPAPPASPSYDRSAFLSDLPAPVASATPASPEAAAQAVATSADLLGALPPPGDDPFASVDGPGGSFDDGGVPGMGAEPDRGLFDMPQPSSLPPEDEPTQPLRSPPGVALGRLTPSAGAKPADGSSRPQGRPDDVGMADPSAAGSARRVAGMVVNLAVASALLVALVSVGTIFLNEGRLDPSSLSLEPLKALFQPPAELRAVDVSNGLYDTKSGRQLFYVRGEVENRSRTPAHIVVKVSIVDGALTVGTAKAPLGFSPTPEDLYAVSSPQDLAALGAKATPAAEPLAPGARQPFLLAFYDYPPDLSEYQLEVTVERAPADVAAGSETAER